MDPEGGSSAPRRRTARRLAGDGAEDAVAAHLTTEGWTILARNVRVGRTELDIVALDAARTLVIVEVRSRTVPSVGMASFGAPEESVDRRKVERLYAAAWRLLRAGDVPEAVQGRGPPFRVDLVTVVRDTPADPWRLRGHLEGVAPP